MKPSVLSKEQKEEIRANYTGRHGEIEELVQQYGVSRSTIVRVLNPDYVTKERKQQSRYMTETYNRNNPRPMLIQLSIHSSREPEIHAKLCEIKAQGAGARQHYIKNLILNDIKRSKKK